MSQAKRDMESHEAKRGAALKIALDAGALRECEIHEYVIGGRADVQDAYMLGNSRFSAGDVSMAFANRREMTDYIKEVVEERQWAECPWCAKNAAE